MTRFAIRSKIDTRVRVSNQNNQTDKFRLKYRVIQTCRSFERYTLCTNLASFHACALLFLTSCLVVYSISHRMLRFVSWLLFVSFTLSRLHESRSILSLSSPISPSPLVTKPPSLAFQRFRIPTEHTLKSLSPSFRPSKTLARTSTKFYALSFNRYCSVIAFLVAIEQT